MFKALTILLIDSNSLTRLQKLQSENLVLKKLEALERGIIDLFKP